MALRERARRSHRLRQAWWDKEATGDAPAVKARLRRAEVQAGSRKMSWVFYSGPRTPLLQAEGSSGLREKNMRHSELTQAGREWINLSRVEKEAGKSRNGFLASLLWSLSCVV